MGYIFGLQRVCVVACTGCRGVLKWRVVVKWVTCKGCRGEFARVSFRDGMKYRLQECIVVACVPGYRLGSDELVAWAGGGSMLLISFQ